MGGSDINEEPTLKECCDYKCKDDGEVMLSCKICDHRVHLRCSDLPLYQLMRITLTDKRGCDYICVDCIEIPTWLQEMVPNKKEQHRNTQG